MSKKKVDELYQELEDTFSWKEFFVSLYDALVVSNDRMDEMDDTLKGLRTHQTACMEEIEKKQDKNFSRMTWIMGIAFVVYLFLLGMVFDLYSGLSKDVYRNENAVELLKQRADMNSATAIDTYELHQKEIDQLHQEINWLKENMQMKTRGATVKTKEQ